MFQEGLRFCKDLLFPIFCVECGAEGQWICNTCLEGVNTHGFFACPLCHQTTDEGNVCRWCRPAAAVEQVLAMSTYDTQSALAKLIHVLKYAYATDCLEVINELITCFLEEYIGLFQGVDAIVPIPLHKRRYAERGFNQAELIAQYLGDQLHIPVVSAIERRRYTKPQATQRRLQRWRQMDTAFVCTYPEAMRAKRILLVDDVYTTGATMHHSALAAASVGAASISGFVLARGEIR